MKHSLFILGCVCWLLKGAAIAQIPVRATDVRGRTIAGQLLWDGEQRRWWIVAPDGDRKPLADYSRVVLASPSEPAAGQTPDHELRLWGVERLPVQIERLEGDQLHVRALGSRLRVPLASIAQLTHFKDLAPVFNADFDQTEQKPELAGDAAVQAGKGVDQTAGLVLQNIGDRATTRLDPPIAEGVAQLLYFDPGPKQHRRGYLMEFTFRRGARRVPLQVLLLPRSSMMALAMPEGPPVAVEPIERSRGWHRLGVVQDQDGVVVTIDDALLAAFHQPLGELVECTVAVPEELAAAHARGGQQDGAGDEPFRVDEMEVRIRRTTELPRQPAADQDEVLLYGGTQFYGTVTELDARHVALRTEYALLHFPWPAVHRVFLHPRETRPVRLTGQRARLVLRTSDPLSLASDVAPDAGANLEGILRGMDQEVFLLEHPTLGEVRIPVAQTRFILPGRYGHWLLIDSGFHHLGDAVELGMQRPYPEGNQISWHFQLDSVPETIWLVMDVVDMEPMYPGASYYGELRDGHLRTTLLLNGTEVDFVNRYLRRKRTSAVRVRIPLPREQLKEGDNVLTLKQRPQRDEPGSYDDCGIWWVGLEWPAAEPKP